MSSGELRCVVMLILTDVSDERTAYIMSLMMEAVSSSETSASSVRLQGATSNKARILYINLLKYFRLNFFIGFGSEISVKLFLL